MVLAGLGNIESAGVAALALVLLKSSVIDSIFMAIPNLTILISPR